MNKFNFLTHKCICSNLNTRNLKLFCNHGGIYRFQERFWRDPDLRVEIIFRKERAAENGGIDFEIGDVGKTTYFWTVFLPQRTVQIQFST